MRNIILYTLIPAIILLFFIGYNIWSTPYDPWKDPSSYIRITDNHESYFQTEKFNNLSKKEKISKVNHSLSYLYSSFENRDISYSYGIIANQNNFRRYALQTDGEKIRSYIRIMNETNIIDPDFIFHLKEQSQWAEKEKEKSAEGLYQTAQGLQKQYEHEKANNMLTPWHHILWIRDEYVELAAEKGHKKALKEQEANQKWFEDNREKINNYVKRSKLKKNLFIGTE